MEGRHKSTGKFREETVEYYRALLAAKNQTLAQRDKEIELLTLKLEKLQPQKRK